MRHPELASLNWHTVTNRGEYQPTLPINDCLNPTTTKKRLGMAVKKKTAKTPAKKAGAVKRKAPAIQKKYTKTEILNEIAQNTDISKKEVAAVLDELSVLIERHIKKRSVGEFTLPGLLKIKSVVRPARPARKGVPNPFRPGETMDVPRKPATTRVKVLPLKKLKEFAL
jgi:nucleoid DNA-binding protein